MIPQRVNSLINNRNKRKLFLPKNNKKSIPRLGNLLFCFIGKKALTGFALNGINYPRGWQVKGIQKLQAVSDINANQNRSQKATQWPTYLPILIMWISLQRPDTSNLSFHAHALFIPFLIQRVKITIHKTAWTNHNNPNWKIAFSAHSLGIILIPQSPKLFT